MTLVASASAPVHPALILPFAFLLLLVAVMPLTPQRAKHLWEHYYAHVAIGLGLVVVAWYLMRRPDGSTTIAHTLQEYFSFICLIGSLFVVAGGILIQTKGEATPVRNTLFLAIGAVAANLIGTTGASMVLIRPYIRMNKIRISPFHIVFFIFIVANCGGALTPIGDPPLFLGYLRGVPFFWLLSQVLVQWLVTLGAILLVFYLFDRWSFTRAPRAVREVIEEPDSWSVQGLGNTVLLAAIIGAVFLPASYFMREAVMLAAAVASQVLTPQRIRRANEFTYGPIKEVGYLFLGIFLTMMPALGYLQQRGGDYGFKQPTQYYLATGSLSAVLDNAPTYLNFLQLAQATLAPEADDEPGASETESEGAKPRANSGVQVLLEEHPNVVVAVSLGAVFFGAMTYIGNGPNFMVKSIAQSAGVRMPTFFGFVFRFSVPILLPILIASGYLFLR